MIKRPLTALLALFTPVSAMANETDTTGATTTLEGLTAAQLLDLAAQAQAAGGNGLHDAERIYRALTGDPDAEIRAESHFRMGMLLASSGRLRDAALSFRSLLDEKPDAAGVRLELARVLHQMGDEGGARAQVRQAQASGLPPEVAIVVDRFATALRSTKDFGGSFEIAIAPDSNVNRATDARQLDTVVAPLTLDDDARKRSGTGIHPSGQVYVRLRLGERWNLVPRLTGDGLIFRDSQFNDITGSALLGVEYRGDKSRVTPSIGASWRFYGGRLHARTWTSDVRWIRQVGKRGQANVSLSIGHADYLRNNLQDGMLASASVGVERAFSARTGGGISFSFLRQDARDPGYATTSGGVTLFGWREMGKTTLFASGSVRRLESDARLLLFHDRRKEWFTRATIGGTFRQIQVAGFSPMLRVTHERNWSSLKLYDYRRMAVDIGISRAF